MAILRQLIIMTHPLLRLATLAILLSAVACERPLQLDWETTEGRPVLLGIIEPGAPLELRLVRSIHPLDTLGFPPLDGAEVRLFHAGTETTLQPLGEGFYVTPPAWQAEAGVAYRCEVLTAQGETLTVQEVVVPAKPIIDPWQYEADGYQSSRSSTLQDLLTLALSPPHDSVAYYALEVVGIQATGESASISAFRVGGNESLDAACGFGGKLVSSQCNPGEPLTPQWAFSPEYRVENDSTPGWTNLTYDSVLVVVSSLSAGLYRYETSLLSDELSSVFFYTDSVYSNVQGGEGILGAKNTQVLRIAR